MIHGGNVWNTGNPSDWLDFSANLRPEGPPDWVSETLRSTLDDIRFYPDPDMKRARRGLAGYLGIPEECVLPTAGGTAAYQSVFVLKPGQSAEISFPNDIADYYIVECAVNPDIYDHVYAADSLPT